MPLYNHHVVKFNNRISSRSDNLTTSVIPPSPNVPRYFKISLKDNNTLLTVFNKSEFAAGTTVSSGDSLRIYDPKTNSLFAYYVFRNTLEWRGSGSGNNQDNTVIPNNTYVAILRRSSTPKTYTVSPNTKITTYAPF